MTAFRGWPVEALEFFEGLEADNSKTYWQRNKATYDTMVRAPMEALLAELAGTWGEGRIFRPYRDVRFSRDKSPYKTFIAATLGDGYVQLTAQGLGAGCGMWEMAKDQLDRYREAVNDERTGPQLENVVVKTRAAGVDVSGHDMLKTAPRGYAKDHPRIELMRFKGLVTWRQWAAGPWLATDEPKERVGDFLALSRPVMGWLRTNVGPSTLSEARR
jgi:uncharacterized protein (TIGR02453 family)